MADAAGGGEWGTGWVSPCCSTWNGLELPGELTMSQSGEEQEKMSQTDQYPAGARVSQDHIPQVLYISH